MSLSQTGAGLQQQQPLLEIRHLSKTFGVSTVLSDVSLTICSGEIRALAGANGSGKSTLIKILSGFHSPDPGAEMLLDGRPVIDPRRDADLSSRLHFIHQDLALIGSMNAVENMALSAGFATTRAKRISWPRQRQLAVTALEAFDLDIDLDVPVSTLSSAEQSMVAIARATGHWTRPDGILVLDEPTVAFTRAEAERLFVAIERLAARGAGVLFVSHYVEELFRLASSVTVLRDGRQVLDRPMGGLQYSDIIDAIVGVDTAALLDSTPPPTLAPAERATPVFAARGLTGSNLLDVSFELRRGEIVGIAGVDGSGREEVAKLVAGAAAPRSGHLEMNKVAVSFGSPREALSHKVVLVPRDRRTSAVFSHMDVREHITLPRVRSFYRGGRIRRAQERREATRWARTVNLSPCSPDVLVEQLSGGNQQKVMMSRGIGLGADVLVLDEPGQGVDIGAKMIIYELLHQAASTGTAILVCSTDIEELVHIAQRVVVLVGGRIGGEFTGADVSVDAITRAMLAEVAPIPVISGPEVRT